LSGAQLPALASSVVGAGAAHFFDQREPGGRISLGLVRHPGESLGALRSLLADPHLTELERDAAFWADVERGAVASAMARPSLRTLVNDRSFRTRLATLGAISESAAREPSQLETELAVALAEVGPRLQELKSDPALASLLDDPQVRTRLSSGNSISL